VKGGGGIEAEQRIGAWHERKRWVQGRWGPTGKKSIEAEKRMSRWRSVVEEDEGIMELLDQAGLSLEIRDWSKQKKGEKEKNGIRLSAHHGDSSSEVRKVSVTYPSIAAWITRILVLKSADCSTTGYWCCKKLRRPLVLSTHCTATSALIKILVKTSRCGLHNGAPAFQPAGLESKYNNRL
jgi:hypothetical protein